MTNPLADTTIDTVMLAHAITKAGSKQSYYSARFLADKDCVADALKAYAYFRWVDDYVDDVSVSDAERQTFLARQEHLITRAYLGELGGDLSLQERMIAELIDQDPAEESKLHSYIHNMLAIICFDANRRGRYISQAELNWYSVTLGKAVVDNLQYFIGDGYTYPESDDRCISAVGAHIAHMLRDLSDDIRAGYINLPREILDEHMLTLDDLSHPAIRAWVRSRVDQARTFFQQGKRYYSQIPILRYKLVCYLYCARYDGLLRCIEHDAYCLRDTYAERYKPTSILRIAWMMNRVILTHLISNGSNHKPMEVRSNNERSS